LCKSATSTPLSITLNEIESLPALQVVDDAAGGSSSANSPGGCGSCGS
jgi:hypothetical protein